METSRNDLGTIELQDHAVNRTAVACFRGAADPAHQSVTAGTLAVAASTLAVFALFQPWRRRVQVLVDHRFTWEWYEADRIAAAFAERLRAEVNPNRIPHKLEGVLAETVAPTSACLWFRGELETMR